MALFGTRKPRLQAKVLPKYPVRIEGFGGLTVEKANGIVEIGPDLNLLPEITEETPTGYVWHFDGVQTYSKIAVGLLVGLPGEPGPPGPGAAADDITYDNSVSLLTDTNAQGAIDELAMLVSFGGEKKFEPEFVTYVYQEPVVGGVQGIVGYSLKYTDWWITGPKIHRWSKPQTPLLQSIEIDVTSGAGGGGTSAPAFEGEDGGLPSTGAGGAGGAVSNKDHAADDLPDDLVFVVGEGGMAGGWLVTPVWFPEDVGFPANPASFIPGQGVIFETADGGDGGFSAVFDAAVWDALGADDDARLIAFKALSYNDQKAATIQLCTGGKGGVSADNGDGVESTAGEASGGDHNRNGSDGSGGGYNTNHSAWKEWFVAMSADPDTTEYTPGGGIGAGGSAGGRALNDGLWENHAKPMDGMFGRNAGAGGSPKTSNGNHDGSHGGPPGGGGGGGQAGSWQGGRVLPGGFGGWGRIIVKCRFDG